MSETITKSRMEDGVAAASAFLERERGVGLDGTDAARQVAERVISVQERAQTLLTSRPIAGRDGYYAPLSQSNANQFNEAVAVLPGHMVLVPSALVEPGEPAFYPAVVSEDGLKNGDGVLRLHVLKQHYRGSLGYGAAVMLAAAGQSETEGVGEHGRTASDGVEAEHFTTLLTTASDEQALTAWQNGRHINHDWRGQASNSVTTEASNRLLDVPQATITITRQQVEAGQAVLLWHEGLRDEQGRPEAATRDNALVIAQGLGYEALRAANPGGLDNVRRLIA